MKYIIPLVYLSLFMLLLTGCQSGSPVQEASQIQKNENISSDNPDNPNNSEENIITREEVPKTDNEDNTLINQEPSEDEKISQAIKDLSNETIVDISTQGIPPEETSEPYVSNNPQEEEYLESIEILFEEILGNE